MHALSPDELAKLQDQSFLLAKKQIDQRVTGLLLESQKSLLDWIEQNRAPLTKGLSLKPRKVSKGENYQDLPYWVSDFPADMSGSDIWTYRTVVWWGHFISFSLILAGRHKAAVKLQLTELNQPNLYFTIGNSPWKLELSAENQRPCKQLGPAEMEQHFSKHSFLKMSKQEKLENINQLPQLCVVSFEHLIKGVVKLA